LFDVISSKEFDVTLTENLKNEVYRRIKSEEKIQSEGIDVFKISSKILEAASDIKEFSSVNNVYIGLTLTQQLFYKYQGKINEALQNMSSSATDYSSYIQKLINGDLDLFVLSYDSTNGVRGSFRTPEYPKYPLKEVVKMIKSGLFDGLYTLGSQDDLRLRGLIQSIKNTCKDISDDICLRSIAKQNYSGPPFSWSIKLKDIKSTNKIIYNYYYTKFLTIPIESSNDDEVCDDLGITSGNCYEEKIKMFILNDIQYERYRDIDFLRTGTYSVPKIYIDPFDDVFNVKYAIGIRILL
jgi:hypothetical protein